MQDLGLKVQTYSEHVVLILSFTVETVKGNGSQCTLLDNFLIAHCVNVLDGEKHSSHLQSRKGGNMTP